MHIDLIGKHVTKGNTAVWKNIHRGGRESASERFQLIEKDLPSFCPLSAPHSIILTDFNSDGRADLLLTCEKSSDDDQQSIEIWVAASILIAILILVVLTAILKSKEWREGEMEKRKQLHAINFDAL